MKLKILLINPWIYDFAAYNLWSRPLGLLKVAEFLSQFDVGLSLIDCTDIFKQKRYGMGNLPKKIVRKPEVLKNVPRHYGRYGMDIEEFRASVERILPFDAVLVTSIMSYWYLGALKAIEIIKSISADIPVILGGIYATLYHKHAASNSNADFIFKGHINEGIKFAFQTFGYRLKQRKRSKNNTSPYYRLGLYKSYPFVPILTSRGCPYNCPYCASGLLAGSFIQRQAEDVFREIKELYSMGVRDFAFYDDALLVNAESHIKVILKAIIKSGFDLRFHCPNGLHARFIDNELAYLMKKAGFKTLRLSLETIDKDRQEKTGGKVTSDELKMAVRFLKESGFSKKETGVYLMYGLPGQGLDEIREGVKFLKGLNVRINLTEFSPIPETVYWKELLEKGIIDEDIAPLLTNNTVFPYIFSGYDVEELKRLKIDVNEYNALP